MEKTVTITGQMHARIEVHPCSIVEETIKMFRSTYEIDDVDGIDEKGEMYEHVEYHTSHSWTSKENRGKPTQQQKDALMAVNLLKLLKHKIYENLLDNQ